MQNLTSQRLSLPVYLLALGFGLGASVAVISVSICGLLGAELAPHPALTTLPYGLQAIGIMISALFSSLLQAKFGRKRVAFSACCIGMAAGIIGVYTLSIGSFILLCLVHFLIGMFLANMSLLRFAALDLAPKKLHGKALSMVMFGGTFAALLGPFITRNVGNLTETFSVYQLSYMAISFITVLIGVLVLFLQFTSDNKQTEKIPFPISALFHEKLYIFALACGGLIYGLMNMIMINSAIQMKYNGFSFNDVSYYIQIHVLAMYVPSLFNIKILDKLGIAKFLMLGFILQLFVSIIFFAGQTATTFLISLFLLGLSWNILYTAGSYIVGHLFSEPQQKFKAQGVNDLTIGMISAVGSLSAGAVLGFLGWNIMHVISVIITVMLMLFFMIVYKTLAAKTAATDENTIE